MPKRPIENYQKASSHQQKYLHTVSYNHLQHGSLLLLLPHESLTHVTSYLPPPSLLALARTCRHLCEHVDDDNTWLRALLSQCLGIGPEDELDKERILLLQRTENTWRKEFIFRYELRRRWERSRSPTVTHSPQDSSIDGVHLISEHGLLTSSIQYGIVARSIPLRGKVLKGYIDASGTGLGIGNPNLEFIPNVSACAISSDGGAARVFWGKRNGEVALTVANRIMDSRVAAKFIRCGVNEQHEGAVQQLVPDSHTNTFLSAGADGRIKLWNTKSLRSLWSTDKQQLSLIADPFISIAGSLGDGFVAGALKSGDILLYDLHESETPADEPCVRSIHQLRISPPIHNEKSRPTIRDDVLPQQQIAKLWLYPTGEVSVILLVQYTHHPQFYRIHANVQSHDVMITSYGDNSFSSISTLEPIISTHSRDNNMLIAGDQLGFVSIYDADAPLQTEKFVAPIHRFEAHTDGSVTAISWSPATFATGSARGTTVIWDSLTLEPMRYFTTPAPRPAPGHDWDAVSRVLIDKELVVIIVGNRVMTWKVGQVGGREYQHKRAKHANTKINVTTKGHQQYEMYKDIAESYKELEYERAHSQRKYGREREQRSTLDTLGLSELEAVEYVLMLSREEEEVRQQRSVVEEGVFEGDFDDLPSTPTSSQSRSNPDSSHRPSWANGRRYPPIALSTSNQKVQVSPPFVPEPMEAGVSISPLRSVAIGPSALPSPMTARSTSSSSLDHFPAISSSLSSTSSSRQGMPASPEQPRSAWSTPLKSVSPLSGPSSPPSRIVTPTHAALSVDVARRREATVVPAVEEMDDDLRLAIELSLAEARSRGEDV